MTSIDASEIVEKDHIFSLQLQGVICKEEEYHNALTLNKIMCLQESRTEVWLTYTVPTDLELWITELLNEFYFSAHFKKLFYVHSCD